jgi:D-methionine transport system ATP-binding protein
MIEFKNVYKSFESTKALDDVSLTINDGEIFGIIGQSGAGKSTLLRTINALEPVDSGDIIVDGRNIKELKGKELRDYRKKVPMIFQNFALLETQTVFKNIALPLECAHQSRQMTRARVDQLAAMVGIQDKLKSKPRELSGGQKQRVGIARALALDPKIILSDEATSALDPLTTQSILQLLMKINKELGITIVVVTHQMEVVKAICSRIAIISNGKILQVGKTDEIFLSSNSAIKTIMKFDELLPEKGINIRLFFPKSFSTANFITHMARTLDIDFSIAYGQLEKFRDDVLGELIINIKESQLKTVADYLKKSKIGFEVITK